MLETEPGDTGFDLGASMDAIASEIMGKDDADTDDTGADTELPSGADEGNAAAPIVDAQAAPQIRAAPKAWPKEQHENWGKLDPKVQEYLELREKQMLDGLDTYKGDATYAKQLREVFSPYSQFLQQQGVNETQAVQFLLNTHYGLTNGSPEQRLQLFNQLGKDLGLFSPQQSETGQIDQNDPLVDLKKEVTTLKSAEEARQREAKQAIRQKADLETSTFATDPANVHFNDVAHDMVPLINAGYSLKDAYDTAVLKNPVTRQKELDRLQTEAATKKTEEAKTVAEAARRASSSNIRSAHPQTAPTEPKGSMEDTMRDTLKRIRARSS